MYICLCVAHSVVVVVVVVDLSICLCVAHSGSVQSVNIDGLTQLMVSSGSDCLVRFWKFKSCQLRNELKMDAAIATAVMHRERFCAILLHFRAVDFTS